MKKNILQNLLYKIDFQNTVFFEKKNNCYHNYIFKPVKPQHRCNMASRRQMKSVKEVRVVQIML